VTFGSETSGGIRHVEAYRIHTFPSVKMGVFFKSARTRGGTVEDISVHDMDIRGAETAFRIEYNWYPSYSYAKIPDGITNVPDYWRVLAQVVPPERGLPHLRNVTLSDIRGSEVRDVFSAASYAEAPVENLTFTNIEIQAKSAGTIQNAANWKFVNMRVQTADGSRVTVKP
jgi:hypothetical protein